MKDQDHASEPLELDDTLGADEQFLSSLTAHVSEEEIWGLIRTSNAEFIIALRNTIGEKPAARAFIFSFPRLLPISAAVCIALLMFVLTMGEVGEEVISNDEPVETASREMEGWDLPQTLSIAIELSDLTSESTEASELADYLEFPAVQTDSPILQPENVDLSVTDELLALDTRVLNAVLDELQHTDFF